MIIIPNISIKSYKKFPGYKTASSCLEHKIYIINKDFEISPDKCWVFFNFKQLFINSFLIEDFHVFKENQLSKLEYIIYGIK